MVETRITHIICNGLSKYINAGNVKCYPYSNMIKITFNIKYWLFEISYFFIDDYYKIKTENNQVQNVIFLTKSKRFHKDIQLILKDLKLSKKTFENHIIGFITYINRILEKHESFNYLDETYIPDLSFDGIFI